MLIIHDCLKILKHLALFHPFEQLHFDVNNLMLKDGRVKMADAYLRRKKLAYELSTARKLPNVKTQVLTYYS